MVTNLIDQLKRDEGEVLHVYLDSVGIRTAGVGHNLEAHGIDLPVGSPITQAQSDFWLQQDIKAACDAVHGRLPWTDQLDDVRRAVPQNMCFNMGISKLLGFHHFLAALQDSDYQSAASNMLSSLWARQVGVRAQRLSQQVISGVWQ